MSAMIDRVQDAFAEGRRSWIIETSVDPAPLIAALDTYYGISDEDHRVEAALTHAFLDSRRKWGNDWYWQTGDVAEAICAALVREGLVAA